MKKVSDNTATKKFVVTEECEGMYIRCKVAPVDTEGIEGAAVWSAPVYVECTTTRDFTTLSGLITEAEGLLKNITDDMMKQFKDCISWMEDNNINEFTVDMDLFNTMVLMEAYDSCDIETDDYFESVSFDSSELDELVSFI